MNPFDVYSRTVGSSPYIQAPVEGGVGWMLGAGANRLVEPILRLMGTGMKKEQKARLAHELQHGRWRYALPAMFAALAAGRVLAAHGDPDREVPSFTRPRQFQDIGGAGEYGLFKRSSLGSGLDTEYRSFNIPKAEAMTYLLTDRHLNRDERRISGALVADADEVRERTSGEALTRKAVEAGSGFIPAYVFGRITGRVFGLPRPLRHRAAMAGGLAGAVKSSGIIDDIFRNK